jgi:hypothetical protein
MPRHFKPRLQDRARLRLPVNFSLMFSMGTSILKLRMHYNGTDP